MANEARIRLQLFHKLEQIAEGLEHDDPGCEQNARIILAKVATSGSCVVLRQVIRGIIQEWDDEQPQWDNVMR